MLRFSQRGRRGRLAEALGLIVQDSVRIRVSTALLLLGLLLLPMAAQWAHPSYYPAQPALLHNAVGWLYNDASFQLLIVAILLSAGSAAFYFHHNRIRSASQSAIEAIVGVVAVLCIPAY